MARDGSGNYTLPVGNPVVPLTPIASTWANNTLNDIATAMSDSLSRSGQGSMSSALALVAGSAAAPSLTFGESDSGFYRAGSDQVGFSSNGAAIMQLGITSVTLLGTTSLTVGGAATITGVLTVSNVATFTTNSGRGIELNRNSAGNLAHLAGYAGGNGVILSAGARYDSPANWVAEDTKGSTLVLSATGALSSMSMSLFTGATLGVAPPWQSAYTTLLAPDGAAANTPKHIFGGSALQIPLGTTTQRPASPLVGDIRYNSTLSVAEIYTGTTWVAIFTSANGEKRNFLINGGFDVWQRGTTIVDSATSSKFYTADRWGFNRTGDVAGTTISLGGGTPFVGTRYSLTWQRTPGNASAALMAMFYALETADSMALAGKTVTLSFWVIKGGNYSGGQLTGGIYYGTGTDQRVYAFTGITTAAANVFTLSGAWTKYTLTAAIPTNATEVGLQFSWVPVGVAGANDAIGITAMQLEVGPIATDYMGRSFAQEQLLCQRYYEKTFNYATAPAQAVANQTPGAIMSMASGTTVLGFWAYKVSKRTIPTITTYNPTQANSSWRNTVNTADTAVSIGASGENSCVLQAGAASDIVGYQINAAADAEL